MDKWRIGFRKGGPGEGFDLLPAPIFVEARLSLQVWDGLSPGGLVEKLGLKRT